MMEKGMRGLKETRRRVRETDALGYTEVFKEAKIKTLQRMQLST